MPVSDDILHGRGEREYDSSEAKPPRRTRDVKNAISLLTMAVDLLAYSIDEGPLRTKVLGLNAKAKTLIQEA